MKPLLIAILMMTGIYGWAQKTYQVSKDEENGQLVFKGPITFDDLVNEAEFKWFKESMADYKPDFHDLRTLADNLPKYKLVVFMGTWCDDSQYLVPKLYSLLQKAYFPLTGLTMYGVDRQKNALGNEKVRYKISKVPTVILYRDDEEVGRITELAVKSVEHDLAELVRADMMKQNR